MDIKQSMDTLVMVRYSTLTYTNYIPSIFKDKKFTKQNVCLSGNFNLRRIFLD